MGQIEERQGHRPRRRQGRQEDRQREITIRFYEYFEASAEQWMMKSAQCVRTATIASKNLEFVILILPTSLIPYFSCDCPSHKKHTLNSLRFWNTIEPYYEISDAL
jgi:hypothetical protein